MIRPLRAVGATLLVAALLSGCGADDKLSEKAVEKALSKDGAQVDIDGDRVTVEDEDGNVSSIGEGSQVPDDFPEEVPLPEGDFKISSVFSQGEETAMMLSFEADELESLESRINSSLSGAGYTLEEPMRIDVEGAKQVHISAKSTERDVSIVLMVSPEDGGSAMYNLKKPQG